MKMPLEAASKNESCNRSSSSRSDELDHNTFLIVVNNVGSADGRLTVEVRGLVATQIEDSAWVHAGTLIGRRPANRRVHAEPAQYLRETLGILIGRDPQNNVCIWTDRFSSLPCYATQREGRAFLSNDLGLLLSLLDSRSIEPVAFWECLLFDWPLQGRTPYKEVIQLSAATKTVLAKELSPASSERYWNYQFESMPFMGAQKTAQEAQGRLKEVFKRFVRTDQILFPISGGLDSRLLATILPVTHRNAPIMPLNFAANPRSYDYRYANQTCKILGLPRPIFHKLDAKAYRDGARLFAKLNGGLISPAHAHLISWLATQEQKPLPHTLVHGFFADASCGFACSSTANNTISESVYFKVLMRARNRYAIPPTIAEAIVADLEAIRDAWLDGSSVTSFKEYLYVALKHPVFQLPLADLYSRFVENVFLPHCEPEVADFFFGLPTEYRVGKRGVRMILAELNPRLYKLGDVSSFPHAFTPDIRGQARLLRFKFWNALDWGLSFLTKGHMVPLNPFETEYQPHMLRRPLKKEVQQSVDYFISLGALDPTVSSKLQTRGWSATFNIASWGLAEAYQTWSAFWSRDH